MCSTPGDRCATPDASATPAAPVTRGQPDNPDAANGLDAGSGLLRLGLAIDELADAARGSGAAAHDVTRQLASVWDLVAQLDPELTRRLAGYGC
jgi:ABC-type transporter Mla subunit MlaD